MVLPMFGIVVVSSRRHTHDRRLVLLERGDELVFGRVHAEVDHLEARAPEHHDAEVLADVVQVAP